LNLLTQSVRLIRPGSIRQPMKFSFTLIRLSFSFIILVLFNWLPCLSFSFILFFNQCINFSP
jgi:hypothetical protein